MRETRDQTALLLRQGAQRAQRSGMSAPGRFVAGDERRLALHEAREAGVTACFDGGAPEAERVQVCFVPEGGEPAFTYVWMRARWNAKFGACDHRSLLGSLLALGTDRSFYGDLTVGEGEAYMPCLPEMADRLPLEWVSAGRTPIRVERLDAPPVLPVPESTLRRDTVPSLRLDAVLAAGMNSSRSKAAEMIRAGLVMVNHIPEERTDHLLHAGDLLSVRGFGRIRLRETGEPTRKDRLPVTLEIFTSR